MIWPLRPFWGLDKQLTVHARLNINCSTYLNARHVPQTSARFSHEPRRRQHITSDRLSVSQSNGSESITSIFDQLTVRCQSKSCLGYLPENIMIFRTLLVIPAPKNRIPLAKAFTELRRRTWSTTFNVPYEVLGSSYRGSRVSRMLRHITIKNPLPWD